jgi:hypothetical protein
MSMGWSDLTSEGRKYFKELEELSKLEVKVGFQEDAMPYKNGTSVIEVAVYNEFGTSNPNSKARPFMRQSFENNQDKLQKLCNRAVSTVNSGGTAQTALNEVGSVAVDIIQTEIREGNFESNAESTIRIKSLSKKIPNEKREKASPRPLIDTAHMMQSIHYQIKEKE